MKTTPKNIYEKIIIQSKILLFFLIVFISILIVVLTTITTVGTFKYDNIDKKAGLLKNKSVQEFANTVLNAEPSISFVDHQVNADVIITYPNGSKNMEYSINDGKSWATYSSSFKIDECRTITARCILGTETVTSSLYIATGKKYVEDFDVNSTLQYGQGSLDSTSIITAALTSNYKYIEFGKTGKNYKISKHIVLNKSDKYIIGNGSTIFTDDSFIQTYSEFLIKVTASNIVFDAIKIEARETIASNFKSYKTQLGIAGSPYATDITIKNCEFKVPSTVSNLRPWNNLDIWGGWQNITVQDSIFELYSDSDAGGNIMARELSSSKTSSNLVIKNNKCYKRTHDEIIWIVSYKGAMKDIKITGNEFIMYETNVGHDSPRCITIGANEPMYSYEPNAKLENVEFSNNTVVGVGSASLFGLTGGSNIVLKNNNLTFDKIRGSAAYGFDLPNSSYVNTDCSIEGNTITINNGTGSASIGALYNLDVPFVNNTVIINTNISNAIFTRRATTVIANNITVNGNIKDISRGPTTFTDNIINITGYVTSNIFDYNNSGSTDNLTSNVLISRNTITSNTPYSSKINFVLLNSNILFNGYTMTFENNIIHTPKATDNSNNSKCSISTANSGDIKNIYYIGNILTDYTTSINQWQVTDTVNVTTIPYQIETSSKGNYLKGIQGETTMQELVQTIVMPANYTIGVTNINGQSLMSNQHVGTGSTIIIKDQTGKIIKEYKVVIKGDITADGIVNLFDITTLIQYVFNPKENFSWDESIKKAAKTSNSVGEPGLFDIQSLINYCYNGVEWP